MPPDSPTNASPSAAEQRTILCPACGYDLRGAVSNRCSECGLEIMDMTQGSSIQWTYRKSNGWFWAFIQSIIQITSDPHAIRHEAAQLQDFAGARWFRRWVALLAALAMLVPAIVIFAIGGFRIPLEWVMERGGWLFDALVPWVAVALVPPAIPIAIFLLVIVMTLVPRRLYRLKRYPPEYRNRALALADYSTAPLALMPPAIICLAAYPFAIRAPLVVAATALAFSVIGAVLFLASGCLSVLRVGQWYARIHHQGQSGVMWGIVKLLGMWLFAAILLLGVLPWCIGFVWIVIDSLG